MKTKKNINHIFIIDDDEFLLHAMKRKLEMAEYKVTVSSNIQDAFFKLNMLKPDLIILDIMMPDINGIEFMNLTSSQLMTVNTPIILMSSLSKHEIADMGYDSGAVYYLTKPFDVNKLPSIFEEIF